MIVEFFTNKSRLLPDKKLKLSSRFNYRFALDHLLGKVVLDVGSGGYRYFGELVKSSGREYYHCDVIPIERIGHHIYGRMKENYFVANGTKLPPQARADTITALWWIHHYQMDKRLKIIEDLKKRCRRLVIIVDYNVPNISKPKTMPPHTETAESYKRGFTKEELKQLGVKEFSTVKKLVLWGKVKISIVGIIFDGYLTKKMLIGVEKDLNKLITHKT